jgi:mono/diheme cytochrome c family protein
MANRKREDHEVQEQAGAESSLINLRTLVITVVGFLVLVALVFIITTVVYQLTASRRQASGDPFQPRATPAGPNLQVNEPEALAGVRATETARLAGYAWIDRDARRVQIPIERAMDIVAQRGFPVFPQVGELPDPDEFTGGEGEGEPSPDQAVARGQAIFQEYGCGGCHTGSDTNLAPTLVGLYGNTETLEGGVEVEVDEQYLIDSILHPADQVVAGYPPIMPSYQGRISDQQLEYLIEYIKSLVGP